MSEVADLLENQAGPMVQRWMERLQAGIVPAVPSPSALRDHIPLLMGELQLALRRESAGASATAATEHGRQRFELGFDLQAIVREYDLLQSVVVDLIEAKGLRPSLADLRVLTRFFSHAVADSVTEYLREQERREATQRVADLAHSEDIIRQLKASDDRLRRVVEASGAGLWSLNAATDTIDADARLVELMGLPEGSTFDLLSGLNALPVENERLLVEEAVRGALQGKNEGRFLMEFRTGGQNGVPLRWVESRAQVFFDPEGKALRLAGAMVDVTTRRSAELEREAAFAQVAQVLESMGDAFFTLDAGWRVGLVNGQFERLMRKPRADALGRVFWELFPDAARTDSAYFTNFQRCMQERVPVRFVDLYPSLDLWTEVSAYPQLDGGIAIFFRDVSSVRRAERTLRERAELEQQLIGIVSHDLRNPISAITMSAATLLRRADLDERHRKPLGRILAAAERTTRMICDLLDFTQARLGGGLPVKPRNMDAHVLARQVVDEIGLSHPERRIELTQEGPGEVVWDADRVSQVLSNLLSNALHYSPATSPVQVRVRGSRDEVCVKVSNRGPPIPAELLPHLFLPMRRGASGGDRTGRSVGLGLYIVRQVVDSHHGSVRVSSSAAEGTCFIVTLPRSLPERSLSSSNSG